MKGMRVSMWIAAFGFLVSGSASPSPPPVKACATPEFRQFDFWLGDWTVTGPKGNAVGKNLITREQGGCVWHEHWTGAKGSTGESFNIYDQTAKRWHQTWVDNGGTLLLLDGGLVDGRVRQIWTVSSDSGATWATSFDGFYAKP